MGSACGGKKSREQELVNPVSGLTQTETLLLKNTMENLAAPDVIKSNGADFFLNLFREHPEYQNLFPSLKQKTFTTIHLSPDFRAHGATVFRRLADWVNNMDDPEKVADGIAKLAKFHRKQGVTGRHFRAAQECFVRFIKVKLGEEVVTPEVEEAWVKMWGFILEQYLYTQYDPTDTPNPSTRSLFPADQKIETEQPDLNQTKDTLSPVPPGRSSSPLSMEKTPDARKAIQDNESKQSVMKIIPRKSISKPKVLFSAEQKREGGMSYKKSDKKHKADDS